MHHDRLRLLTALDGLVPVPIWNDAPALTNEKIEALGANLVELNTKAQTIQAVADREGRQLTEDEAKEIDNIDAEFKEIEADIERRRTILAQASKLTQPMGRQTVPEPVDPQADDPVAAAQVRAQTQHPRAQRQPAPRIEPVHPNKGKWGWHNVGEFCRAVRAASARTALEIDPRLAIRDALTTYSSEGVDGDGGFAVPPDFRSTIMQLIMGEESLLGRTDQQTTSSNTFVVPVDETTPWQSSGGIQAYWGTEAGLKTQSKVALQDRRVSLDKLYALVPVSDELLEDAPSLTGYINRKAPEKMNFKVTDALFRGTGAGQPLGILNSPALISVTKEVGQAADTIVAENILKMYSRMYPGGLANAVWLVNPEVMPQLFQMTMGLGNVPIFMPPNGLSSSPFASMLGRPIIPTQGAEQLGDLGDILFVDLRQYLSVTKGGGIRQDISIHLWFDYDVTAFRFVMRIGGQPWWSTAMSPREGNHTVSPFVALAERA